MGHVNMFRFLVIASVIITFTSALRFKSTSNSARDLRHRRQSGAGYFFAQNVSFGLQPAPPGTEFGPWGPWTESSDCSRTCGGGISFQDRICLDVRADGRHSCFGASRRHFSCNIQDCPEGSKDFRSEQCARFNTVEYEGKYYSWLPFYKDQIPCELNCMPRGERFYTRLARKVIDGTQCYDDGSLNVCVDGICMPVGCDMILGSSTKEDECRECGGDGSSCQIVKGVFDKDDFEVGYNDVLLVPTGATSILIKELRPTNNYLAIRNGEGTFYLNGNWRIEFPRDLRIAGTIFHYERKPHGSLAPESLRAKGPTTEPIFIVLLYQEKNLGVSYEYSIPIGVSTARPDTYAWNFGDFEECSQTCGGGVQYRPVRCVRNSDRDIVDEGLCDPSQKPPMNTSCNTQPCPARWQIGEWSNCSHPCGGGSQFRLVFCHQIKEGNTTILVPEQMCDESKPLFMRACNEDTECPEWLTGEWSECNRTCGYGYRSREVYCRHKENDVTVEDNFCNVAQKPAEIEECKSAPCEGVEWILSDWSGCEGLCSPSMESREAHCANEDGVVFPDEMCDSNRLPELTRPCPLSAICEPMWHASEWTECSVKCGSGVQTRVVFCGVWEENSVIKIDESKCTLEKMFDKVRNCSSTACEGIWFTGPWNRCSSPCGGGERHRKVLCFHEDDVVSDSHCDPNEKPFEKEPCNMLPCDGDEVMLFDGCKDLKYGCCPDGITPAGFNFAGCPKMNTTSNVSCEDAEFGCCSDGFTLAMGPFKKGCPSLLSCNETKYGCCPDEVTPSTGPNFEGCIGVSNCTNSTYGCCPDGVTDALDDNLVGCNITDIGGIVDESSGDNCSISDFGCCLDMLTPAIGPEFEGCDEQLIITTPENCSAAEFGCCDDNVTVAKGPSMEGCFGDEGSGDDEYKNCNETTFGCCPDNTTAAKSFDDEGCPEIIECGVAEFGCCPDNVTAATGENYEGCQNITCQESDFGCCPDNITFALGVAYQGCENVSVLCTETEYGCCPDNITIAQGPSNEGCDLSSNCTNSEFGCCPDNITEVAGPNGEGCDEFVPECSNSTFGCCPDNVTSAIGPDGEGCEEGTIECSNSTFGCCSDNVTVTTGSDGQGCDEAFLQCSNSTFGCCQDNFTAASGPDNEGCDAISGDCNNSTYGCCSDNVTFAGPEGCPNVTNCSLTEFGCCPDNMTTALGPDSEGCENETLIIKPVPATTLEPAETAECINTLFGCCPDMKTLALGPNLEGCCFGLKFGCCPDNLTAALGPRFQGCSCHTYPYGCCPDGLTPAQGTRFYGCKCEHFRYGCCQDKVTAATGANFEGCNCQVMLFGCCPDGITPMTGPNGEGCGCASTRYGCCPDGKTTATSADLTGCPCDTLPYGCCPDGRTPSRTSDPQDCPCDKQRYGCCLDGRNPAQGPNYEGCPCESTRFGCCFDGRSVAQGPNFEGCPCEATQYGCCADGFTHATGPEMHGCPKVEPPKEKVSSEVCGMPKDAGTCQDYMVKWYFDVNYGACSRFWYGGCGGNGNVFATEELCKETCVTPEGADACLLPKVPGPCPGKYPSFYYDVGSKSCEDFTYSGCLGNNNRFVSKEECDHACIMQKPMEPVDVCVLPKEEGPCDQAEVQWYYNDVAKRCEQFYYGGCRGNLNRFETRAVCEQACLPPTMIDTDVCRQPQTMGTCYDFRERWYYDAEQGQCHRFYYSGCGGNDNNFASFFECEKRCSKDASVTVSPIEDFKIEFCFLGKDSGQCSGSYLLWYYDTSDGVCKEFHYGGCQGNGNRFKTRKNCETTCENSQDICRLPVVKGPCSGLFVQWYYDHVEDECYDFKFSGCQGNANRFNSKEDCQRHCGKKIVTTTEPPVLKEDVCSLPVQPGPCYSYLRMWYYDSTENACKSFVYGGCEGNTNRFEERTDCEQRCIKKSPSDVCRLSVDPGPCSEAHKKWFYDAQSQSCLPFVYKGCGGNKNRFKSADICHRFCSSITAAPLAGEGSPYIPVAPATPMTTTTTTTTTTTPIPTACPPSNCANIQCPFGIEEETDVEGCSTCRCSNPCEVVECPDGSRCSIDIVRTPQGGTRTEPVCRRMQKVGECPPISNDLSARPLSPQDCTDRCRDDADCRGDDKCCNNGCANICMQPEDELIPASQPVPLTTSVSLRNTAPSAGSSLQIDCTVYGPEPVPEVTWYFEGTEVYSDNHREIFSNGSLLIKKTETSDSGEYTCTAKHDGSVSSSSTTVHVQAAVVEDTDCMDSPQFANCEIIVKAKYCNNKYYGRYCCASCKAAGQLHNWPLE